MIFEGSRYERSAVIRVKDAEGKVAPAVYSMISGRATLAQFKVIITGPNDRLDLIAYRLWGDPQLWWAIANLNPEYLDPDNIPLGSPLRIPIR